jgi:preprotein translocase subunit SecD
MRRMVWCALAVLGFAWASTESLHAQTEAGRVKIEIRLAQKEAAKGLEAIKFPAPPGVEAQKVYVHKSAAFTNTDIASARAIKPEGMFGQPAVELIFTKASQEKMAEWSEANVGKHAAVYIDGKLLMAPRITSRLSTTALLSGGMTEKEAERIANGINAK